MTTDQLPDAEGATTEGGAAVTVRNLRIETTRGVAVVPDASFEIAPGEVLGVVGESGSGKTTVGLALLGHARRGLRIAGGTVMLGDRDILRWATRSSAVCGGHRCPTSRRIPPPR